MFLACFAQALSLWKNPHYLGLVFLLCLGFYLYTWGIRLATSAQESVGAAAPGCLVQLIGVLVQGLLMGFVVLFALPIFLGVDERFSWEGISSFILLATRAGILASIAITLLSFIPGLGRVLASSPALEALLVGGTVFRLTAPLFFERSALGALGARLSFPGLGVSLAFLGVTFFLSKILLLALETGKQAAGRGAALRGMGPILDLLIGIFVLSAYASWSKLSLHQL